MAEKKTIFKRYRLLPLIGVGIVFVLFYTLAGLVIWTLFAYNGKTEVLTQSFVPGFIYLSSIFFACMLMTALIKGGTVFPAAVLSLAAAIAAFFMADSALLSFGSILLKSLLSLLSGVLGFTITKLLYVSRRAKKRPRSLSFLMEEMEEDYRLNEPGGYPPRPDPEERNEPFVEKQP